MLIMLHSNLVNKASSKRVPYGLMFHHFHGGIHMADGAGSLSQNNLDVLLQYAGINNILTPNDWISAFLAGELSPTHRCLTFDDGLKNQIDVALPVLQKYGLKAFWFICSAQYHDEYPQLDLFRKFRYQHFDTIEDYYHEFFRRFGGASIQSNESFKTWYKMMSATFPFYSKNDLIYRYIRDVLLSLSEYTELVETMIRSHGLSVTDLATNLWLTESDLRSLHEEGHMLGLHSYDHPTSLSKLDELHQRNQYSKNAAFIQTLSGQPISMAHPCNSYNKTTLSILAELGIKIGFRSNMTQLNYINSYYNNLQCPRADAVNILRHNCQS